MICLVKIIRAFVSAPKTHSQCSRGLFHSRRHHDDSPSAFHIRGGRLSENVQSARIKYGFKLNGSTVQRFNGIDYLQLKLPGIPFLFVKVCKSLQKIKKASASAFLCLYNTILKTFLQKSYQCSLQALLRSQYLLLDEYRLSKDKLKFSSSVSL